MALGSLGRPSFLEATVDDATTSVELIEAVNDDRPARCGPLVRGGLLLRPSATTGDGIALFLTPAPSHRRRPVSAS